MKPAIAVPFKRALPHRLSGGAWEVLSTESPFPLPSILSGHDYNSVLKIRRGVSIDVVGLRADCELAKDVPLMIAASWFSSGTSLKRSLSKEMIFNKNDTFSIELYGEISGGDIAGTLHIDTSIIVAQDQISGTILAARKAGSILLRERHTVQLDTSMSFFPVEVVDFNSGFWANPDAGWRLSWNVFALDQPFLGSVRLLINSSHARITRAISGSAPTAEATAIRSAIYFDVAKSLVTGALSSDEFVERDGEFSDDSCGKVIYILIRMLFPNDRLSELAATSDQRPDQFSTDLQGRLKVFWN